MRRRVVDGLVGGGVAAVLSGAPSTLHALATRRDVLEATRAAGTLVLPVDAPSPALLAAAVPVHVGLSLGWGAVLGGVLPRRREAIWGAVVGLGIAALDLGGVGRLRPRVAALPQIPQILDHVAFGVVTGAVIAHRRRGRRPVGSASRATFGGR